jgi:hypothetical protein
MVSNKGDDMLVFELTPDHEELEIHCDEQGVMELKKQLEFLVGGGGSRTFDDTCLGRNGG